MNPNLTIIIPMLNAAAFIKDTLNSLRNQTFENFEVWILDGGSTDTGPKIVETFGDTRFKLMSLPALGLAERQNWAINKINTKYLARNDADDISMPTRFQQQIDLLESNDDVVATYSYFYKFGMKRKWENREKQHDSKDQFITHDPLKHGCQNISTFCGRTDCVRSVGGFNERYYPADDWEFELRLSNEGKALILTERLVGYRFSGGSTSDQTLRSMRLKERWATQNFQQRVLQKPEISFEDFSTNELRKDRNAWECEIQGMYFMRKAGMNYLDGNDFGAAWNLLRAVVAHPKPILGRIKRILNL